MSLPAKPRTVNVPRIDRRRNDRPVRFRPTAIEVDLDALRDNARAIAALAATPVCAVIKADAYGHGAPAVAPEFAPTIRTLAAPEPARTGVESFFPSAPVAELPPPLPDDPVPPEPPARALDPVGRGVEPQSAPPQQ